MAKDYARIPDGYYDAKACTIEMEDGSKVFAQLGLSKKSGTKQVLVSFEIQSGEYKGVKLPWFGYLTKDSAERTIQSLRLAGWKGNSFKDLPSSELTEMVQVTVQNETYQGKIRSRVAWVGDVGGPQIILERTIAPKDASSLDKEFADFLK